MRAISTFAASKKARTFVGITGANVLNNAASFVITVLAARTVGPENFGKLSIAIAIVGIFSSLLDWGFSVTLVRFYNGEEAPAYRRQLVNALVRWKIALLIGLLPGSYLLRWAIVWAVPTLESSGSLVQTALLAAGLVSLWTTVRAADQAACDFRSLSWYTVAYGVLRLLSCAALLALRSKSLLSFFMILYPVPLATLCILNWFTKQDKPSPPASLLEMRSDAGFVVQAAGYSTWIAVADVLYSVLFRLAQFALARAGAGVEVGLYGAALTFVTVFTLLNDALRTLVLPEVTALRDAQGWHRFRTQLLRAAPSFFAAMFVILALASLVQFFLLGPAYRQSTAVFIVLGTAVAVTMYFGIVNTLVHAIGKPSLNAYVNIGRVSLLAISLAVVPKTAMNTALILGGVLVSGEYVLYRLILARCERIVQTESAV